MEGYPPTDQLQQPQMDGQPEMAEPQMNGQTAMGELQQPQMGGQTMEEYPPVGVPPLAMNVVQQQPLELAPQESYSQRTPRTRQRSAQFDSHPSMMSLSNLRGSPRWTMLGKPRTASADPRVASPDPGSYLSLDPCTTSKMQRSPRAGFGSSTASRQVLQRDKESWVPGPGNYNTQTRNDLGNKPTSALIGTPRQRERLQRASTPDPGAYAPAQPQSTSKFGRTTSADFGRSGNNRFPMLKERAPGPGAYQGGAADISKGSGPTFLASPRKRDHPASGIPDPGAYAATEPAATSRMLRSPQASMNSQQPRFKDVVKESPGPGGYNHKEMLGDAVAVGFTRSSPRAEDKPRNDGPEPGQYAAIDPGVTSKMPKQIGHGFAGRETGRMVENGANTADAGPRSPRNSVGIRKLDGPGPGTYDSGASLPATVANAPRWGFGDATARPGQIPSRFATNLTPGPGTYVRGTMVGVGGPNFSFRGRAPEKRVVTPGPGQYGGHFTQFI